MGTICSQETIISLNRSHELVNAVDPSKAKFDNGLAGLPFNLWNPDTVEDISSLCGDLLEVHNQTKGVLNPFKSKITSPRLKCVWCPACNSAQIPESMAANQLYPQISTPQISQEHTHSEINVIQHTEKPRHNSPLKSKATCFSLIKNWKERALEFQ